MTKSSRPPAKKASPKEKPPTPRPVTIRALMELRVPDEPQIEPSGKRVAFTVNSTDWEDNRVVSHIYVQKRRANPEKEEPRQLTRGDFSESHPRWSPENGKWLTFLSARAPDDPRDDEEEQAQTQVWRLPMDGLGGEAEAWTEAPQGIGAYEWLPDGSGIVYLSREPRPKALETRHQVLLDEQDDVVIEKEEKFRFQIWTCDAQERKATLIHPGDFGIGEIAVSPNGKFVAFATNYTGDPNDYHKIDLFTVEIATGKVRQLTDEPGGKFHPRWSPDGKSLLYARSLNPALSFSQTNLYVVPMNGGASKCVTDDFPHDITGYPGFQWAPDGRVYVHAAVGTETHLFVQAGEEWHRLSDGPVHLDAFHVGGPESELVAATLGTATEPPELFLNGKPLTNFNRKWREEYEPVPAEVVRWPSCDGLEIEGLLYTPGIGVAPYPCVTLLHGGPYGRAIQKLTPYTEAQVYAARGYAVFMPNYRGSEGYGEAFGTASRNDLGGADYQDVITGIDALIEQGRIDPARLGIEGSSYGGYLVNWAIGQTERFKAAVSKSGIFSLTTDFSNSQAPRWELEYLSGPPWEQAELYQARSPMSRVQFIKTPVLLMHGETDANTFISNSYEMYQALRVLGRTVKFAHFPREGHGFGEPRHRADEARRTLDWYDTYVLGGGTRPQARIGDWVKSSNRWELLVSSARGAMKYAGEPEPKAHQYVEVVLALRDGGEERASFALRARDVRLGVTGNPADSGNAAIGFPVDAMGESILARAPGWSLSFAPPKDKNIRSLTVPLVFVFKMPKDALLFTLTVKDFPQVLLEIVPPDDEE